MKEVRDITLSKHVAHFLTV